MNRVDVPVEPNACEAAVLFSPAQAARRAALSTAAWFALLSGCDQLTPAAPTAAPPAPPQAPRATNAGTTSLPGAATPAPADPTAAPTLRYTFQEKQYCGYVTTMVVENPDETENWTLESFYRVVRVRPDRIQLDHNGHQLLRRTLKPGDPWRVHGGGRNFPPAPELITISPTGELLQAQALSSLDHLLGFHETLALERLPPQPQTRWQVAEEFDVGKSRGLSGSTRFLHGARSPATEKTDYRVESQDGDLVWVSKQYQMQMPEKVGSSTQIEMTGNGRFAFNTRLGRVESSVMDYSQTTTRATKRETLTAHVQCKPMEAAKFAEWKQRIEDQFRRENEAFEEEERKSAAEKKARDEAKKPSNSSTPAARLPSPSATGKLRLWRDVTGKFQTEAELVGREGNLVLLKRKDGAVLKVPLDRLSEPDRKAAEAANPFRP